MSCDFISLTPIRIADLFDGRLKDVGIHEHHNEEVTADNKCLTDGRSFLWVYGNDEGLVSTFTTYGGNATERILATICDKFDVDLVSEYDPEFWGFETEEEWDAATAAGYWTKGEWNAAMAGYFAIARWPRDADVATIARCILGILKYEPHAADTRPLRSSLEAVIEAQR